jgi:glutathione S-transferase
VILYTCGQKKRFPGVVHPCAKAANALDDAGYEYELRTVGGYRFVPWTRPSRNRDRAEVKELSGTNEVPVLLLDDGKVISDSRNIARWARAHPRHQPEIGGG